MPEDVVIVGAGTLGQLVHDCLEGDERWRCVAFHDDAKAGTILHGIPVYGTGPDELRPRQPAIIAIGDPATRRALVERLEPQGLDWRTFVDRRSLVGREADLGRGTIVLSFAMVASSATIGPFCWLNAYSHVGKGSIVGAFTSVLSAAAIGDSVIGAECVLGMKSICLDGAVLSDRVSVAPMTLVRRSVPEDVLVAGNPARVFKRSDAESNWHKRRL